jgi:hypothetical protein
MSQISAVVRGLMSRLNLAKSFVRAHERRNCTCVGELYFIDRGFATRGIIEEISCGGLRFRPVHSFILERSGDAVSVRFDGYALDAQLMNVSPRGYGLKLRTPLTEAEVEEIVRADEAPFGRAA